MTSTDWQQWTSQLKQRPVQIGVALLSLLSAFLVQLALSRSNMAVETEYGTLLMFGDSLTQVSAHSFLRPRRLS